MRLISPLIKSVVVLSIAKYWAAKPQMAQYVVSPMRRWHFVNGLGWACGQRGRAQPVHAVHRPRWPVGVGPALERGAQARGGAAADARRGGRAALARARPAAVQARAVAAEGRGGTGRGAEGARD